ncbi:MAG: aldo/keto reductase, partial [Acidimicrobiales bacterium]|nr:aldo/keto reductase [Acidimicrobiales bacterium]
MVNVKSLKTCFDFWIVSEVEASLKRLNVDHIDLYQIHRPDEDTDIDETLSALSDLVHSGKIRYFGSSTFPAQKIVEAQWRSKERNFERFVTEQPPYSMLVRGIEKNILPTTLKYNMGVLPWSPLAGGWLSGKFGIGKENKSMRAKRIPERYDLSVPENQTKVEIVSKLQDLADEADISLIDMALAFVLEHPAITSAIIGPRTVEHLESQLGAASITLEESLLDKIDEIVPPGTNINKADSGWAPKSLTDKSSRRRPH